MAVQAVDEDDVDGCFRVVVDAGYFEALDLIERDYGGLSNWLECSSGTENATDLVRGT